MRKRETPDLEHYTARLLEAWGDMQEALERYEEAYEKLEQLDVDLSGVDCSFRLPEQPEVG